jgi:glycosyltransferase involved in cell wall biosynthesis
MFSLQKAGIFISSNDISKMAQEIVKLIKDEPKRKQLGEYALKRVEELTWDRVSLPLIEAYNYLSEK